MIPRRLHLFWTGPMPEWAADNLHAWHHLMPHWEIHGWATQPELEQVAGLAYQTAHLVHPDDHIRHAASLVRWWTLSRYGGIWADTDVTPLEPLDPLTDAGQPFVSRFDDGLPIPCVIGGPAGHPVFAAMLAAARLDTGTVRRSPHVTGCHTLRSVLAERGGDFRTLPTGTFIDHDSLGRPVPAPPKSPRFATHRWETSSQRKRAAT